MGDFRSSQELINDFQVDMEIETFAKLRQSEVGREKLESSRQRRGLSLNQELEQMGANTVKSSCNITSSVQPMISAKDLTS
eukprot:767758-Hanusia_phi.AAC.2